MFKKVVFDPTKYLFPGFAKQNLCIPAAILMHFYKRTSRSLNKSSLSVFSNELNKINFNKLLSLGKVGLSFSDLPKLEQLNSPIPEDLVSIFPPLSFFKGIALNLYQVRGTPSTQFDLFPLSISVHSRDSGYFQCDLIQVTATIVVPGKIVPSNHVLAVPRLATLVTKYSSRDQNRSHYSYVCRSCLAVFSATHSLHLHLTTCPRDSRRGSMAPRRRSRNVYMHRTKFLNKFTGQLQTNGLHWRRSHNFKMIKPVLIGFGDCECYSIPVHADTATANSVTATTSRDHSIFDKTPKSAIMKQKPMSFAYVLKSLYDSIPLPESMSLPRVRFCTEKEDSSLFIQFFLLIRNDLVKYNKLIADVLSRTVPPLPLHQRTPQMKAYFDSIKSCQLCGKIFGSISYSNITKTHYRVVKQFDHNHYKPLMFPSLQCGLRAVLCAGCNLNLSTEKWVSRTPLVFYLHNGQNYDFVFLLKSIMVHACQHKITYNRRDGSTYERRLLKGNPFVLFKSENTPLSITIKFQCPFEVCECSMKEGKRQELKKKGEFSNCPFRRKVRFSDSLHFLQVI